MYIYIRFISFVSHTIMPRYPNLNLCTQSPWALQVDCNHGGLEAGYTLNPKLLVPMIWDCPKAPTKLGSSGFRVVPKIRFTLWYP